jgi:prepilin-type N-terminal cleavage/methylation domain-containing protein/prepilin-type processing-associated H-X9-DG protein
MSPHRRSKHFPDPLGAPKQKTPSSAFTLIELLATMAIVALLATFAATRLHAALSRSQDAKTASDLRQMAILVNLYAADNNGRVVPAKDAEINQWQLLLARLHTTTKLSRITDMFQQPMPPHKLRQEFSIFAPAHYRVPANYWDTGYGINMLPTAPGPWVANTEEAWGEFGKKFRQAEITHPSKRPLIFPWPAWNAYGWDTPWAYDQMLSPAGRFHVLFFDGHVASFGPQDKTRFQKMLEDPAGA